MRYTGIYTISKESLDARLFLKNLFTYRFSRDI